MALETRKQLLCAAHDLQTLPVVLITVFCCMHQGVS
jgi:hypothetical protein